MSISKDYSFFMSNPPIALASKKTETYCIWLPAHVSETHLINFLLKSQPNTPPSPIYLVPDTTSKLPSFCFLWEEVRKKCADILFFHQTRFIACLQWKALWFKTSVPSKDSSKIPYFPDFIMRSGCFPLYLLWGLLHLHWMPNQTHFLWVPF